MIFDKILKYFSRNKSVKKEQDDVSGEKCDRFVPKDQRKIEKLKQKKDVLEKKIEDVDEEILRVEKSARTTFARVAPLHNYLRKKSKLYYRWHLNKYANIVHILLAGAFFLFAVYIVFVFGITRGEAASNIDLSGTCKQYDQSTNCADSRTVKVAVNGSLSGQTGTTSSGSWSVTGVSVNGGDILTVFIDGVDDANEANAVTKVSSTPANISGILLYERHLTIGSSTGETITNANLSQYDYSSSSDEDVFFDIDSNNDLTIPASGASTETDQELYILASNTYEPDTSDSGNIKTPNLEIPSSAILNADGNTIELTDDGTPFTKAGTFNYDTSTFKYTSGSDSTITAANYYHLDLKPSSGSASCDYTVSGAGDTSYNGDYTQNGTYNGAPAYEISGTGRWIFWGSTMFGDAWAMDYSKYDAMDYIEYPYYNQSSITSAWSVGMMGEWPAPTVSACAPSGGTYTLASGTFNIYGNLTNGDGTHGVSTTATTNDPTLNIDGAFNNSASATFIASNSGTFSVGGNFSNNASATFTHSSGTLAFDGSSTQTVATGGDSLNNVTVTNTSADIDQSDAVTIAGTLTINSSANYDINGQNITLSTLSNSGTFKLQGGETTVTITTKDTDSGTVEYTGSGTYTAFKYGNTYYNLKLNGSGSWTPNGNVTANSINIASGTFNASSRTITLSGSGTPFTVTGTFTEGTSTVIYTGSSATNVAGTTYYNLTLNQTGTTFTATGSITASGVLTINAGTFDADDETITLSGAGTPFVKTGTFTASTSTVKYTGVGSVTVAAATYYNLETSPSGAASGGYTVSSAGDSSYNGSYTQSGTYNGQPAYTNGSRWLYYAYSDMPDMDYMWVFNTAKYDCMDCWMDVPYVNGKTLPGTWYAGMMGETPAPTVAVAPASNSYTLASGTINVGGNFTNGDGTNAVTTTADTNDPTFNIDGAFSNSAGATFTASASGTFSVGGNFTNNATAVFTHSSGTLTLDGQGSQSLTVNGDSLYNLTVTNASSTGVTLSDALTVVGTFTDTTASSKITFNAGSTYAFANININGQSTDTRIVLTSSGTWYFNVSQISPSASYVNVTNSDASGGNNIDATTGCYDGSGNTNWTFTSGDGITVSGTVYTAENKSTNIGAGKTVALSINGAVATTVETTSGGIFSFSSITVGSNNTVAVFIDGETEKASLITQATNSLTDITGLELYTSHVILSHQTAGPMTNTLLATADNVSDTDLLISVDGSNNATFTADMEVWILTGKAYTPGGNVTVAGLDILFTSTFSPEANTLTLTGSGIPFATSGTFNEGTSTVIYTGSSATNVAGATYNNLTFNKSGTTFTATGSTTVKDTLTITAGTFDADDETVILSGDGTSFVVTDIFDSGTSTIRYTGAGDTNITATTYYHLEAKPSGTELGISVSGAGVTAVNGTYVANGTYNGETAYQKIGGGYWIWWNDSEGPWPYPAWALSVNQGESNSSNWIYYTYPNDGNPQDTAWVDGGAGYDPHPTVSGVGPAYTYTLASGTINVGGNFTNGDGTNVVTTTADTNDPTFNVDGAFTNSAGSTFIASNSGTFSVGGNFTNNSTATFTHSSGTLTLDGSGAQTITASGDSFNNLTITNASVSGVSFADSITTAGTFTATTASSKITFHSGSTYAFNAININGQATGTRITLTSSSSGSAWNLNIIASSPTASYVSVKDSNANKDIDATTGGFDNSGNTHWLFPTTLNVSGTVYTAEDRSTNIGAGKTVALSINGGTKTTAETTSGGVFTFEGVSFGTNNTIAVYVSGETEKGSLITQAANGTSSITGLEVFTSHIVLSHNTAGPMSNTLLAIADNVSDIDLLVSVDGSSVATFTDGNQVWVLDGKTYTPGAAISLHDINIDGTLTLGANVATVSGSWDSTGGSFSSSGTVTFNNSSGTETLITGGVGGSGGYVVSGAGNSAYNGTYVPSGTYNGQTAYTSGTKWLFYAYEEMGASYLWALHTTKTDCMDCWMDVNYYNGSSLPGTWYTGDGGTAPAPTLAVAPSGGGLFTDLTKSGNGTLQLSTDEIQIDGTLSIGSGSTFDLNGQDLDLATLSNDGTLKLQGGEATTVTTFDSNSGTIEYSGTSTYSSLSLGDAYHGLRLNGTGGSWTLGANLSVAGVLDISSGTLNASSKTITLSGSGTPLVVTGTFSEGTSTIKYTGSSATNITGTTYYNLELDHTGTTFTSSGNTTVNSVFTITNGTYDASDDTLTLAGGGTPLVNNGTFTASTSTVKYTGSGSSNISSVTYNNLEFNNNSSGSWRPVTVTNSTGSELTNHQVKIELTSSNFVFLDSTMDGHDIRVKDSNGSTNLSYWIESWNYVGETATIWVKIPTIPTSGKTIYLEYGDGDLPAASNGSNTFDFFDDFGGDLSKWTEEILPDNINISSGYLELTGTSHASIGSSASYSGFQNGIIEGKVYIAANSIAEVVFRGNYAGNTGYKSRMDARSGQGLSHLKPPYSSWNFLGSCTVTGTAITSGGWEAFKISANGSSFTIDADGQTKTCSDSSYGSAGEIGLQNHNGSYSRYDDVRVRKYASTEPTTSVGSESSITGEYTFTNNTAINSNLIITSGTVNGSTYNIEVKGNWTNSGTFSGDTSTVLLSGTSNQSITTGTGEFYNLTVTNASSSPGVTFADGLDVGNLLVATTASSTLTFTAGTTSTINDINLNGQSESTKIIIRSTTTSAANWSVAATSQTNVSYVSVSYNNASGGEEIDASDGTNYDGGNNTNWDFGAASTISISGTCKQYDQSTNCSDSETIKVALNDSLQAQTGTTSSGSWTISGVTIPTSGDVITVFVDGVADANEANSVTKYDGSGDISGVLLYERHLTVGSDDNQTITNANLSQYDNSVSSDEDIFFDIDANNDLTIPATSTSSETDQELYIKASNTYQPDSGDSGNIKTPNLEIPTSATLTADGNTIELTDDGTPFTKSGIFNYEDSTFKYTAISVTNITAATYYHLELKPASGSPTYTFASGTINVGGDFTNGDGTNAVSTTATTNDPTFNVDGNLTIAASSTFIASNSATFSIGGSYINSGTFTHSSGAVTFDAITSGKTLSGTLTGTSSFNNLTFNGSGGEWTFSNDLKATTVTVSAGRVIDNGKNVEVAGNIDISRGNNSVPALNSSGIWTMSANGNLKNSGGSDSSAIYYQDDFYNLTIATNITATRTGRVYINKLTMGDNSSIVGSSEIYFGRPSTTTDFIDMSSSASISGGLTRVFPASSTTYSQKAFTINEDFRFNYSLSSTLSMTGNMTVAALSVFGATTSNNESTANCLDMNSYDLTVTESVSIGHAYDPYDQVFAGKIDFGSGTHDIGGDVSIISSGGFTSIGYINFDTADVSVGGSFNSTNIDISYGSGSSLTFDATITGKTIISDSQVFPDMIFNGSGGGWSFTDAVTIGVDLTVTAGTLSGTNNITVNGGDVTGNGTINLTGGTFLLDGTGDFGGTTNWTFYDLTFGDGTSTATTAKVSSNQITVTHVLTIAVNQTLNAGDDTWVLSGSGTPFVVSGTFTASTSTFKYIANADTTITATNYYHLETSPASAGSGGGGGYIVSGAGTSSYNGTYTEDGTNNGKPKYTDGTRWLFNFYAPMLTADYWCLNTTILSNVNPKVFCPYYSSSVDLPGTWSSGSGSAPAPTVSEAPAAIIYTLASGTINVGGNFTNGDGTNAVTTTADTNDPTFNVDGAFSNSAGATFTASNSGTFSVGGNFTNNATGVFTHSNGELTLDGSSTQTITVAGDDFYNLTVTNSGSAPDVTFADSFGVDNQFKAITSDTTIRFTDGITATIVDLNLDGQDANYITLEGSGTGGWDLINTSQTDISYVSVSYSDASGGTEIDASNGTNNDGGNNTNWDFGNTAPVNDSLTFTNPYSSNIAIADNTTEWVFEAKVTDADGPTNINYVELRMANSTDSTQPYDSLKLRWTESTDTFSEQADTQSAATITSTGSDSSCVGNQCTLNFKIKFNDNFLAKDTNYAVELYSIDDSSDSDDDNYVDKYQIAGLSVSINLDDSTIELGSLLPGSVITATNVVTVTTNYPNGYSLSAHDGVTGTDSCLLHTDTSTRIIDYAGTIAVPTPWSGTGLGICLYLATDKEAKWGSGTTEADPNNEYAGVPETATEIHSKTGSPTSGDTNSIGYKIVVPNTQKTGDYSGIITYTATGVLE